MVVVGASLAGARAAESLRRAGFSGELTVVGAERQVPYQRPPLSKDYLAGKSGWDRLEVRLDPAATADISWRLGWRATALDLAGQRVRVSPVDGDGHEWLPYDGLVIATGCSPRWLGPPSALAGVHVLRTVEDADRLRRDLDGKPEVVVIGAGFIGSEVASTCRSLGLPVTVVEALPVPLVAALGEEAGAMLARLHLDHGARLRTGVPIDELVADGPRVAGVRLADGAVLPADVVVVGIGVRPATEWLESSGLLLQNGVVCDSRGFARTETGQLLDNVMAAGDVARWHHPLTDTDLRVEHWSHATEQGAAVGANLMLGPDAAPPFDSVPYFWSDQYGKKISFVGTVAPGDRFRLLEGAPGEDRLLAVYERDGVVVGALGINLAGRIMGWRTRIAAGESLSGL